MWAPANPDWQADGEFVGGSDEEGGGRWRLSPQVPQAWPLARGDVKFWASNTPFRHLAFFPDMAPQWDWMRSRVGEGAEVLNLFGYTGVGSLTLAAAGARVTHVDASKKAINWAKENQAASGLTGAPIRWMLDDAAKFVAREVRRGKTYDVVLVDPPKFGRGPDGEVWDLFTSLPPLMKDVAALLAPQASLVLTVYAIRASSLAFEQLCREVLAGRGGAFQSGELAIREENGTRAVPTSLFTRWSGA
jgi:23S rRNA (cytosine1962-C5)-methyltransferase